jgi:hypothetical protein
MLEEVSMRITACTRVLEGWPLELAKGSLGELVASF